jgi:hypothetical protein
MSKKKVAPAIEERAPWGPGASNFVGPSQPSIERTNLPAPRPVGRPSTYSLELAMEICARLGDDEKLCDICKLSHMPHAATVYRWIADNEDFARSYHCALMAKFDKKSEELVAIADDGSQDEEIIDGADGMPTVRASKEALGRSKLRIETRQWIMAKELPRKYGEMQPITVTVAPGAEQSAPVEQVLEGDFTVIEDDPIIKAIEDYRKQEAAER